MDEHLRDGRHGVGTDGARSLILPPLAAGRLNVLANVVRKPMRQIFSEFSGRPSKAVENEYTGGLAVGAEVGCCRGLQSVYCRSEEGWRWSLWNKPGRRNGDGHLSRRLICSHLAALPLPGPAGLTWLAGSGDVKYHLGTSYLRPTTNGKMVYLSLVANPRSVRGGKEGVILGKE